MADRIRRIVAITENVVYRLEACNGLVLTEGDEQVGERFFRNVAGANRLSERYKYGMARLAAIAGVEFFAPEIEQRERLFTIADLVSQIIGDAAIGINTVKVRTQAFRQKP